MMLTRLATRLATQSDDRIVMLVTFLRFCYQSKLKSITDIVDLNGENSPSKSNNCHQHISLPIFVIGHHSDRCAFHVEWNFRKFCSNFLEQFILSIRWLNQILIWFWSWLISLIYHLSNPNHPWNQSFCVSNSI